MGVIFPQLSVMNAEQLHQVHDSSLSILKKTGVKVQSPRALDLFSRSGGAKVEDDKVYISGDLVDWALKAAPSEIEIFDRKKQSAFSLGNKHPKTRFGVGVTNLHYQDPVDNSVVPFSREHVAIASRLGSALPSFDLISTPGIPHNLPKEDADVYTALEMIANTELPLVILVSKNESFLQVLQLLEHLHGDLSSHPFVMPYLNPVTPLIINDETVEKLWTTIQYGLPVIYSNYSMYGATTPITPEGSLLLMNAELLAGITLCQLMKEGTSVIAGSLPASFDMQSMSSVYTPESFLLNLSCAEMMSHYGIPHCGSSGSGRGWGTDLLAGGDFWMNHLTSCMGKVGLAPFVGGNFDSLAFSPATVVYADHVIKSARTFTKGYTLDDSALAMDEIHQTGPGGNFLMAESTLNAISDISMESALWPTHTLETWQNAGSPKALDLLKAHVTELLHNLLPPADHDDLISKGEAFLKKRHYPLLRRR